MKMKKTLSLFLALAMTASLPFAVLATEVDQIGTAVQVETEYVAKVGDVTYNSLKDAVDKASNGATITLLKDVEESGIIINKDLAFDLGGKTYTVKNQGTAVDYGFKVENPAADKKAKVSFTNGVILVNDANVSTIIENNGNVTLAGVVLNAGSGKKALVNNNGATATVRNLATNIKGNVDNNGTLTVENGTFANDITGNGSLTIKGGKFDGNINVYNIESISGGTFGGTINSANSKNFITGGTFNNQTKPNSEFIGGGKDLDASGNVVDKQPDTGKNPLAEPQIVKREDYITVTHNITDANKVEADKLAAALKNTTFSDKFANFGRPTSFTESEALKKYQEKISGDIDAKSLKLASDESVEITLTAISLQEGSKSFSISITPYITTYITTEPQSMVDGKYAVVADKKPVSVAKPITVRISLTDFYKNVEKFTVNGVEDTDTAKESVTFTTPDFTKGFEVKEIPKASNEIISNKDISVSKPVVTEISTNNLSKSEKALAEAINKGKIKFTPDLDVSLNNVNVTKEQAVNILRKAGITADINSNITMRADIEVVPSIASVVTTEGSEGFILNLNVTPKLYAVLNDGRTRALKEAPVQNSGIALANKNVAVTVPLSSEFSKIKESRKGKFTVNNINDTATSNSVVVFETSNPNGRFAVRAPQKDNKPTPPSGYANQITVLDGTYKIKNKELIKTDSKNTVKFDESAYLVVVKGGYASSVDAKDVDAEYFLTKDDVKKLRIGTVKFEENGKLVDGKISWQARMIKVKGKNRGVYLIEIPIKKNSGYTSSQDVFGNFELRASKPYFFGADETKENVNFYVDVDADVNSGTDEIYDGTHVYEFNDMEDDEITLYGGDGTFIVDTRGQGKLVIKTDVKYNKGIEKANPNANYVYYNSNYPTFNRLGYLYLKANRGDRVYKVDKSTGRLTKMSVPYDRDMEAFKIRTRTLGCYVVAERELDLDKINGIIDPQPVNPVKPPVAPPSIINPPTGANI